MWGDRTTGRYQFAKGNYQKQFGGIWLPNDRFIFDITAAISPDKPVMRVHATSMIDSSFDEVHFTGIEQDLFTDFDELKVRYNSTRITISRETSYHSTGPEKAQTTLHYKNRKQFLNSPVIRHNVSNGNTFQMSGPHIMDMSFDYLHRWVTNDFFSDEYSITNFPRFTFYQEYSSFFDLAEWISLEFKAGDFSQQKSDDQIEPNIFIPYHIFESLQPKSMSRYEASFSSFLLQIIEKKFTKSYKKSKGISGSIPGEGLENQFLRAGVLDFSSNTFMGDSDDGFELISQIEIQTDKRADLVDSLLSKTQHNRHLYIVENIDFKNLRHKDYLKRLITLSKQYAVHFIFIPKKPTSSKNTDTTIDHANLFDEGLTFRRLHELGSHLVHNSSIIQVHLREEPQDPTIEYVNRSFDRLFGEKIEFIDVPELRYKFYSVEDPRALR